MKPHRRSILLAVAGLLLTATGLALAAHGALAPGGHTVLHVGCAHHNHGPARMAGEGQRLMAARAMTRQRAPQVD
jgi:hypothetical protein